MQKRVNIQKKPVMKNKVQTQRKVDRTSRDYWRNSKEDLRRNQQEIDNEMQRKREELKAEEKSFYEVCQWMQQLGNCIEPGILSPQVVKLILDIKTSIRAQRKYYNMDMLVEDTREPKHGYAITDLMDKVDMSRVFLKEIGHGRNTMISDEECASVMSLVKLVEREREAYDENMHRLLRLKEMMEIIQF